MATVPVESKMLQPKTIEDKRKLKDLSPVRLILARPVRGQIIYEFRHGASVAYLGRRFETRPGVEEVLRERINALETRVCQLEGERLQRCMGRAA